MIKNFNNYFNLDNNKIFNEKIDRAKIIINLSNKSYLTKEIIEQAYKMNEIAYIEKGYGNEKYNSFKVFFYFQYSVNTNINLKEELNKAKSLLLDFLTFEKNP